MFFYFKKETRDFLLRSVILGLGPYCLLFIQLNTIIEEFITVKYVFVRKLLTFVQACLSKYRVQ